MRTSFRIALLALAVAPLAACEGPNPGSCIAMPSACTGGTTCDTATGKCIRTDGAASDARGDGGGSADGTSETPTAGADGGDGAAPVDGGDGAVDLAHEMGASLPPGAACLVAAECVSGFCADGVCCDSACAGTCRSCALPGKKGTCSPAPAGPDPGSCEGDKACSPTGECLAANGRSCGSAAACATGFCVEGICCDTSCAGICFSCGQPSRKGTCSPVKGADDPDSCPAATSTCDASGACKSKNGEKCDSASTCASGFCADGVCCATGCTGTCFSCSLAGSEGACTPVRNADDPDTCPADSKTCDATGACKLKNGFACSAPAACASTFCADGVCCTGACDGICTSCNQASARGTCTPVKSADDPDTCPVATSSCSGAGACKLRDGQACMAAGACLSGNCVDGVCCNTACTDTCFACKTPGYPALDGVCSPVKGSDDPDSCPADTSTCDAGGACKLKNGGFCGEGMECASTFCADGFCCNSACESSCRSCGLAGTIGTCAPVTDQDDDKCTGVMTCNSAGDCLLKDTQPCSTSSACASASCTKFNRDADGDGFGDPAATGSFCKVAPWVSPGAWVTNESDCCDKDANMHPWGDFQSTKSATCTNGGGWDFDCSGSAEGEFGAVMCVWGDSDLCDDSMSQSGFSGGIPGCGGTGTYRGCVNAVCPPYSEPCCKEGGGISRVQRCR